MKTAKRVTGIGGVFLRVKDPKKFGAWYRRHLGLDVSEQWCGCAFPWRDAKDPRKKGTTIWSAFDPDTKYFGSRRQAVMVNYRVANLKKALAALKKERVWIDPKGIEASEYGKFAWIRDGEGNRIELWEPPKGG
ncbi:MAG TPA: VOC family protein [Opitutaceae bacterium]|nr:VOC family protein [Opitutaceae bacterium]